MASEVFLIFTTQLYQYFRVIFLFALFRDEAEVFLPRYSQTAILHAAHFLRVVNGIHSIMFAPIATRVYHMHIDQRPIPIYPTYCSPALLTPILLFPDRVSQQSPEPCDIKAFTIIAICGLSPAGDSGYRERKAIG